jgi:hypothetical protein
VYPQKRTAEQQLQGEQFLRGFHGKFLDPRITNVLYDNPFALEEMAAGRLTIYKTVVGGQIKDLVIYAPL